MLRLREDVSFDVSGGWVELHAHPAAMGRGLAALASLPRARGGRPPLRGGDGRRRVPLPVDPVASYLRSAKPIATPRVFAGPEGTLLFVFVLHERGPDAMRARYDRIVRWTGVPVGDEDDLDEDAPPTPTAYLGRSPGTESWGLGTAAIRPFPEAGLVVFVAAATEDVARRALARFNLPEPSIPPPTFEQLQHLAPDGRTQPPGPGFLTLIDRLRAASTTELNVRVKGPSEPSSASRRASRTTVSSGWCSATRFRPPRRSSASS